MWVGLGRGGAWTCLQSNDYWSALGYAPNPSNAWNLNTNDVNLNNNDKTNSLYALAMRSGECCPVPLFSLENVYLHYIACRRNKRNTANTLRFEVRQELNLLALRDALADRSYEPARSACFFVRRPKLREMFAADFRDRVVHHVLVGNLGKIWEPVCQRQSKFDPLGCGQKLGLVKQRFPSSCGAGRGCGSRVNSWSARRRTSGCTRPTQSRILRWSS